MRLLLILFLLCIAACSSTSTTAIRDNASAARLQYPYEPSEMCKGCHVAQYLQHEESMHSKAYNNPLFKSLYFNKIIPRALREPAFASEAKQCIYCHAPVVYMNYTGLITTPQQAEAYDTGVSCDFCHTLAGYEDNGDYRQNPNRKKQGPFKSINNWHAEYSGYLQLAEFCGQCHNSSKKPDLDMTSTYNEWQQSAFATNKVTCQDCHMNKNGFLVNDKAEFESGAVAQMNLMNSELRQQSYEKIYTHAFPGAHTNSQIEGALQLDFKIASFRANEADLFNFIVLVSNSRAGHNMPSGSSDLRFMWLNVTAETTDGRRVPATIITSNKSDNSWKYSVAKASPEDKSILGNDVPSGARLYRAIFTDSEGHQSLSHADATAIRFDNRLKAGELRKEHVSLKLPQHYTGPVNITATLHYRAAPSSYTRSFGISPFKPVVIATATKQVTIIPQDSPPVQ